MQAGQPPQTAAASLGCTHPQQQRVVAAAILGLLGCLAGLLHPSFFEYLQVVAQAGSTVGSRVLAGTGRWAGGGQLRAGRLAAAASPAASPPPGWRRLSDPGKPCVQGPGALAPTPIVSAEPLAAGAAAGLPAKWAAPLQCPRRRHPAREGSEPTGALCACEAWPAQPYCPIVAPGVTQKLTGEAQTSGSGGWAEGAQQIFG